MSVQAGHVLNERTGAWVRTVTPLNVDCTVFSKRRRAMIYVTGADGVLPTVKSDDADTNLANASGMTFTLHPFVPDGDPVAIKRFHDATLLVSDASNPPTVSFDMRVGATTVRAAAVLTDPDTLRCEARREVGRDGSVDSMLTLKVTPADNSQQAWRINAIAIRWAPVGSETAKVR